MAFFISIYSASLLFNGVDWLNYSFVFFKYSADEIMITYEPGFSLYLLITREIIGNFQVSILILYILSLFLINKAVRQFPLEINAPFFLLVLLLASTPALINDQVRQFTALSMCIYGLTKLLNGRKLAFFLAIMLACTFHYSAIIAMIAYPIAHCRKRTTAVIGMAWIAMALTFISAVSEVANLISYIPGVGIMIAKKITAYSSQYSSVNLSFGLGVITDIIVFTGFALSRQRGVSNVLWNIAFLSSCAHITFYLFPIFNRFAPYLNIGIIFLASMYYYRNNYLSRIISLIAITSYSLIVNVQYFNDTMHPDIMMYEMHIPIISDESGVIGENREMKCAQMEKNIENFCRTE